MFQKWIHDVFNSDVYIVQKVSFSRDQLFEDLKAPAHLFLVHLF